MVIATPLLEIRWRVGSHSVICYPAVTFCSADTYTDTEFDAIGPEKAVMLYEITRNDGTVQGHSRSPIFVPIESRTRLPVTE